MEDTESSVSSVETCVTGDEVERRIAFYACQDSWEGKARSMGAALLDYQVCLLCTIRSSTFACGGLPAAVIFLHSLTQED